MEFSRPATRLADANFFFEILGLLDLIIDPTTKPTTIRGTMIGICGMESPLLGQHRRLLDKSVFQNCTQFLTKPICSEVPPRIAYIATTGGGMAGPVWFLSPQIEQNPAFFKRFWANSGKEQKAASVQSGSCCRTCMTLK